MIGLLTLDALLRSGSPCGAVVEVAIVENPKDLLARVPLFAGLDVQVLEQLAQAGATFRHGPGQIIVEQGEASAGLQVMADGEAEVVLDGAVVRMIGPGDSFGEMSVFDGAPRSATVRSGDGGATTFAVSPVNVHRVLEQNPAATRILLATLARRVREAEERAATR